jgi:hypothetical protein
MHRLLYIAIVVSTLMLPVAAQELRLPNKPGSVKFAVIGDTGTGDQKPARIANELASWRTRYPFDFVVMMGDNIYGGEKPSDFDKKFAIPYKPLLDAGVKFYAALGNHDDAAVQRNYKPFNMNGRALLQFQAAEWGSVLRTRQQLRRQGTARLARQGAVGERLGMEDHVLSPPAVFIRRNPRIGRAAARALGAAVPQARRQRRAHGPRALLRAHQAAEGRCVLHHRLVGQTTKRGPQKSDLTAFGDDREYAFMLMEIVGDELFFQTINQSGKTIDVGSVRRVGTASRRQDGVRSQSFRRRSRRRRSPARDRASRHIATVSESRSLVVLVVFLVDSAADP